MGWEVMVLLVLGGMVVVFGSLIWMHLEDDSHPSDDGLRLG